MAIGRMVRRRARFTRQADAGEPTPTRTLDSSQESTTRPDYASPFSAGESACCFSVIIPPASCLDARFFVAQFALQLVAAP